MLWLTLPLSVIAFLPMVTFWFSWDLQEVKNLNTLFSVWNEKIRAYEDQKYQQTSHLPTDLFWDNARAYITKKQSMILKGLQDAQNFFSIQYASCQVSMEELSTVLFFTNAAFAKELRNQLPASSFPKEDHYTRVCAKITSCIEGYADKNLNRDCDVLVNDAYSLALKSHQQKLKVEEANLWKDKYQNGNKDDSAYDLLIDISKIAEIFFQEIKTTPEVLFYRLPSFKTNDKQNGNKSDQKLSQSWWNQSAHDALIWTHSPSLWEEKTSRAEKNAGITLPLTEDQEVDHFIQERWVKTQNEQNNVPFVNYCIVPNKSDYQALDFIVGSSQNHPLELSEDVISEYIDSILAVNTTLKELSNPPTLPQTPKQPLQQSLSTEKSVIDELKKQLESCVKKCETLAFDEKMICKLQCLCAEYNSPRQLKGAKFHFLEEGVLRARICTIPSKVIVVDTKTKKLFSIEEILREVQKVIDGLYDSWELTTKTRVTELLDTSQSKFNFAKNFSFVLGFWTKEPTTTVNEKQVEQAEVRFLEALRNTNLRPDDRNRYVVLENYQVLKSQRSIGLQTAAPQKEILPISTSFVLLEDKINTQNHLISDFLDQNIALLYRMDEVFKSMDQNLQSLWQKKR